MHDARAVLGELGGRVLRVGDDDHRVTALHEACRGAVDLQLAGAALALDRVGLKACAVIYIEDGDLLMGEDVGRLEQQRIDGDRADVVQVTVP